MCESLNTKVLYRARFHERIHAIVNIYMLLFENISFKECRGNQSQWNQC